MSDDYRRRPNDDLVEPLFGALEEEPGVRLARGPVWVVVILAAAALFNFCC